MNLQHVNVKLFVDGELTVDLERFIEVFHRWTAEQSMDVMLIDVADYRHVPNGPGVVLVGHEADYALDQTGGRNGLLYNRKDTVAGSNADRITQALNAALHACEQLEAEFDGLAFNRNSFELFINDRALAPNDDETRDAFAAELQAFLNDALGQSDVQIAIETDPRCRVAAVVTLSNPLAAITA